MSRRVVILGGGPAGVEAAFAAAPFADVTLVSDRPFGSWHKLMPSRIWMTALEEEAASPQPQAALQRQTPVECFDLSHLAARVRNTARTWQRRQHEELERAGVKLIQGHASVVAPHRVRVAQKATISELVADVIIVATGAQPVAPPHLAPDGRRVFSAVTADDLPALPSSLIWIGDGTPSFEFVDMFLRLGVKVTWCVLGPEPRSAFHHMADRYLVDGLRRRGVVIWRHIVVTFNFDPQVAQVGDLPGRNAPFEAITVSFNEIIKTHIAGRTAGFLTLT